MKFTIDAKAWQQAVDRCAEVAPRKETASALDCLRVEGRNEQTVFLTGTDGHRRLDLVLPAAVDQPGVAFLPANSLSLQSAALEGPVTATLQGDDLVLEDGRSPQRVRRALVGDGLFPSAKADEGELCSFTIAGAILASTLKACAAIATENVGTGASSGTFADGAAFDLIRQEDRFHLGVVATDGVSGVYVWHLLDSAQVEDKFSSAIIATSAKPIIEVCRQSPDQVRIVFTKGVARFMTEGACFTSPLALSNFCERFDWRKDERFLPTKGVVVFDSDCKELAKAISRAQACLKVDSDGTRGVNLTFQKEAVLIEARAERGRGESSCPVENFQGKENLKVRVNGERLGCNLKIFGEGTVQLIVTKNVTIRRDNIAVSLAQMVND